MARVRDKHDAVVVGLGAAGCWVVKTLAERGLRVLAIDAGPKLGPADLPDVSAPVSVLDRMASAGRSVQARSVSFHPRLRHLYVDDRQNPYQTRGGDPFLWIRGRQVGGRLHIWARMSLRLAARDFERGAGPEDPWPFGYDELEPFYDRIEEFHGLLGEVDGLAQLPDGRISEPAPLRPWAQLFRERVMARWPDRAVIAPRVLAQGVAAIPSPLRAALATGRVDVLDSAPVARLVLDRTGCRAVGVECIDRAERRTLTCRGDMIFLCASSLESLRILWNTPVRAAHGVLGNRYDQLGRYVLDHNFVVGTGPTTDDYRARMGPSAIARRSSPLDLGADLDFYLPDSVTPRDGLGFERGFGIQGRIFPDAWGMGAFGEMLPHPDNRVTRGRRVDAHGIPVVNIRVRRRANDRRMIEAQRTAVSALAEAAGLPLRMPFPSPLRHLLWKAIGPRVGVLHLGIAIHEAGGARLGQDPARSVADSCHRLWECSNVHVADAAAFPSTGCQNPTLTIMATAARAASLALN